MKDAGAPMVFPFGEDLGGEPAEVAEGVVVLPVPTGMGVGEVNATAIREVAGPFKGGWTVVDTGIESDAAKARWEGYRSGILEGLPIKRVIATHFHSDHIGLAGWLSRTFKAELWTTRTSWLAARLVQERASDKAQSEAEQFLKHCGYRQSMLDAHRAKASAAVPVIDPVPSRFRPILPGETLEIGERSWDVRFGHGHAPDHAVLIPRDGGPVIAGDQVLPMITPNVSVSPSEIDGDPLNDWLKSCAEFGRLLDDECLIIPGHGAPFKGARTRLDVIRTTHERSLDRLTQFVKAPKTTIECFEAFYRRDLDPANDAVALAQTYAHLNKIRFSGAIGRINRPDGVALWSEIR